MQCRDSFSIFFIVGLFNQRSIGPQIHTVCIRDTRLQLFSSAAGTCAVLVEQPTWQTLKLQRLLLLIELKSASEMQSSCSTNRWVVHTLQSLSFAERIQCCLQSIGIKICCKCAIPKRTPQKNQSQSPVQYLLVDSHEIFELLLGHALQKTYYTLKAAVYHSDV